MLCLSSATQENRFDVCDEITDFFHKLSQFLSTVIDDDMESFMGILVRFVSECMTGLVQYSWGHRWCKTRDVCKEVSAGWHHKELMESTVFQPDIESSWAWALQTGYGQRRQYLADFLDKPSTIAERCQQLTECGFKTECHGWCKCFGLACTTLCLCRCEVESHCKNNYYQGSRWEYAEIYFFQWNFKLIILGTFL